MIDNESPENNLTTEAGDAADANEENDENRQSNDGNYELTCLILSTSCLCHLCLDIPGEEIFDED